MICIKNLNKYYNKGKSNEIHVIRNTNVTLPDKGLVCILGESGSGKTTLLNTVSGLDDFRDGEIEVDGVAIKKYGSKRQEKIRNEKFGYIFQNYYLLSERTVEYNLMLGLSLYDIPEKQKQERIDYVLRAVDMWKYKKRKVSQLSGGQQQRVAIARALSKSPQIIFADEPTGNLDEANTMRIMSILKKISKNCLVVVVTHEKSIADFFADRILWIADGSIQKDVDKNDRQEYEYVEDPDIYLGEYEKSEVSKEDVTLQVFSNEPVPDLHINLVCENGKIYIRTDQEEQVIFLGNADEKQMKEGKKPAVNLEEVDEIDFSLEHIAGAKRPKMTAGEIMELAKDNIRAMGKKQIFLMCTLFVMAVLLVLTTQDLADTLHVEEKDVAVADSNYYHVKIEKNTMITNTEYDEYFSQMIDAVENSGMETMIVPIVTLKYQYSGYEQLESMSYQLNDYSLTSLEHVSEKDLLCGVMPKRNEEILMDRWVVENFIEEHPQVANVMKDYKAAVGAQIVSANGMQFEIVGIVETEKPNIYLEQSAILSMSNMYISYMTDSKAKEVFSDYAGADLGFDESGKIKVLVSETDLQTKFRQDMINKYHTLEDLHNTIESLREQAKYVGTEVEKDQFYTPEHAAIDLIQYERQMEEKVEEYGMTYEEYMEFIDVTREDAAYKTYRYDGVLTNGIAYVVEGYIPNSYGLDYIISDDAEHYIEKSVMNNQKEYLLYLDDEMSIQEIEQKIKSLMSEEITQNLKIKVTNEYQKKIAQYESQKMKKLGTGILMMATIFLISVVILYFMMKANAVTRMSDLGVYRMLGISSKSIVGMFAYENFLITTYTSLIGAVLTVAVTYVIAQIPAWEMSFYYPWYYFVATIGVIYLLNISIGILPIRKMLKLPPAQLAAKYDF